MALQIFSIKKMRKTLEDLVEEKKEISNKLILARKTNLKLYIELVDLYIQINEDIITLSIAETKK